MSTYLVDGKATGQFRARCDLAKAHPVKDLPEYLRREYADKGWPKETREVYSRSARATVHRECFLEPLCEGFETTDPTAFAEHMKTVHGKNRVTGHSETFARSIMAGWRGPRLKPDGQPVKALDELKTCSTCGLRAEVSDRAADVLWWAEHERMCVGSAVA